MKDQATHDAWVSEVITRDAANEVRRLSLAQKPEDVKVELPKEFQLPQGVEFAFNPNLPEYGKLREIAVKRGLDQDTVTDLVGAYAETLVTNVTAIETARKAEVAKLGANAQARVSALQTVFTGLLGADAAKHIVGEPGKSPGVLWTADIITALEKVASKVAGSSSFSGSGRQPPAATNEIPGFDKMNTTQRLVAIDAQSQERRKRA